MENKRLTVGRAGSVAAVLAIMCLQAMAAEKPFDPTRDAAKDLQAALTQATAEHKKVLMDVGGNWCPWCLVLERTLAEDAELHQTLTKNYVVVHVNFSKENQNTELLKNYPAAKGYPAWYVLAADGRLLKAEDTSDLEATHRLDAGYNKASLRSFLMSEAR